jgi:hypothetical protein
MTLWSLRIRLARWLVGPDYLILSQDGWTDTLVGVMRATQAAAEVDLIRAACGVPPLSARVGRSETKH